MLKNHKKKNTYRGIFLLAIGIALIAWLPKPAAAEGTPPPLKARMAGKTMLSSKSESIETILYDTGAKQDTIVWEYSTGLYLPTWAERLSNDNTLITDYGNGCVIEVAPDGTIVWQYGLNPWDCWNALRLSNGNTLIGDWNRVIEVTPDGTIVWEYDGGILYTSVELVLNSSNVLITDNGNNRIIEVARDSTIVWEYSNVVDPFDAIRLLNGNTLIADYGNDRVIEVTADGTIVWEYTTTGFSPTSVQRLSNGNTLIADVYNRVIEVTTGGTIVWEYSDGVNQPSCARRLSNGNTLIADYGNDRVIEVGTLPTAVTVSIPDTTFGAAGDTITIPVNTDDLTDLGVISAEFDLTYDSAILTGIDVDATGTLLSGTDWSLEYNVVDGTFSVALAGTDVLAGSGTLINLIFVVGCEVGDESPLHFESFLFNEGTPEATTEDGLFIVRSVYGDVSENGEIHAYDASLIFQYLLGRTELTPAQLVVADVSGDGEVTAYDASLILQYVVGLITEFPVESGAKPATTLASLGIEDFSANPGETITLPITVTNPENLYSVDMILSYDPDVLTPLDVTTSSATSSWLIGHKVEVGNLRILLAGSTPPEDNGELVLVTFSVNEDAVNGCDLILQNLRLNEQSIIPEGSSATLTFSSLGVSDGAPISFSLSPVYPNPVSSTAQVRYAIPEKCNVTLRVYDFAGRLVETLFDGVKNAGSYVADWDTREVASGVYFYRMDAGDYSEVKRFVVMR